MLLKLSLIQTLRFWAWFGIELYECSWEYNESSLSFKWNYFYRRDGEADGDLIHNRSCESWSGRLVRVFAWCQSWSHFPALRRYNSFLFFFAFLHINHQPWLTSDIVNGLRLPSFFYPSFALPYDGARDLLWKSH